eukprot:scaffold502020_cov18-Prasinocladus_malaysianus.AAC.1
MWSRLLSRADQARMKRETSQPHRSRPFKATDCNYCWPQRHMSVVSFRHVISTCLEIAFGILISLLVHPMRIFAQLYFPYSEFGSRSRE